MKDWTVACTKLPPAGFGSLVANTAMTTQVSSVAANTATSAVTGSSFREWTMAMEITPVIVPGLAANRTSEVRGEQEPPVWATLPRSIEKPIQTSTLPPATLNTSSEMPKALRMCTPNKAESTSINNTAMAALLASPIRSAVGLPCSAV